MCAAAAEFILSVHLVFCRTDTPFCCQCYKNKCQVILLVLSSFLVNSCELILRKKVVYLQQIISRQAVKYLSVENEFMVGLDRSSPGNGIMQFHLI